MGSTEVYVTVHGTHNVNPANGTQLELDCRNEQCSIAATLLPNLTMYEEQQRCMYV